MDSSFQKIDPMPGLVVEKRGPALWIFFNRPEVKNALSLEVATALLREVRRGMKAKDVSVLVVSGKGGDFSAGGDIRKMKNTKHPPRFFSAISEKVHAAVLEIRSGSKPVLAAVPGYVGGVAFGFFLGTDMRIASREATFCAATIRLGLVANGGATYFLPRLTGLARATEILFSGDTLSAEEAHRIGLINRIVPPNALEQETQAFAERLARGPRGALGRLKKMINLSWDPRFPEGLKRHLKKEAQAIAWSSGRPDFQEGINAFLEKRKPRFS